MIPHRINAKLFVTDETAVSLPITHQSPSFPLKSFSWNSQCFFFAPLRLRERRFFVADLDQLNHCFVCVLRYSIPNLSILFLRVFGLIPRRLAAPSGPWILPSALLRTFSICRDVISSRLSVSGEDRSTLPGPSVIDRFNCLKVSGPDGFRINVRSTIFSNSRTFPGQL